MLGRTPMVEIHLEMFPMRYNHLLQPNQSLMVIMEMNKVLCNCVNEFPIN